MLFYMYKLLRVLRALPFIVIAGCGPEPTDVANPGAPNIIVVLADDLGYGDLGSYNPGSKIPTPSLDALAAEGMRFTDAHSPSSVCTPTRYGLLTGRYAWRTRLKQGVLKGYDPSLIEPGRETVASVLRRTGYATAAIGKWHLGLGDDAATDYGKPFSSGPLTAGFDHFFGIPASLDMAPFVYIENDRVVTAPTERIEAGMLRREGGSGRWEAGAIAPDFVHSEVMPTLIDRAVRYIENRAEGSAGQPFFLYLALTAPHKPWLPADEFIGRSGAGYYGDFVAQVDAAVKELVDALDRAGIAGNTLLIFTSDNGARWEPFEIEEFGHLANGAWRGQKTEIWEGGHRVPFIANWPGRIPAGTTTNALVSLTDLFATFAELNQIKLTSGMAEDSVSFLGAMLGNANSTGRAQLVSHSSKGMFAIRDGRWKMIEGVGSGGHGWEPGDTGRQLYDIEDDPGETTNLAPGDPDVISKLQELLDAQRDGRVGQ
jgi:arylsulfatase A-like enzyme